MVMKKICASSSSSDSADIVCDCLRYMQEGSDFLKVRSYARQFRRLYKLNDGFTMITWHPTAKKPSKAMSKSFFIVA